NPRGTGGREVTKVSLVLRSRHTILRPWFIPRPALALRARGRDQGRSGRQRMSETLRITVFEDRREVHSEEYSELVELGRQDRDDQEVYRSRLKDGRVRIPVARKQETAVSTRQALVEPLPEGMVRLTNQSQ